MVRSWSLRVFAKLLLRRMGPGSALALVRDDDLVDLAVYEIAYTTLFALLNSLVALSSKNSVPSATPK